LIPTLDTTGAPTPTDTGATGPQAGDMAGQLAQTAQTTGDASASGQESDV
jgi:hypothetical protein